MPSMEDDWTCDVMVGVIFCQPAILTLNIVRSL